jgi:hypothetical protein
MAKVVYSSMKPHKPDRKGTSVTTKRVRGPEGRMTTVYQVDANSPTFGDDIGYVFAQNVKRARRANRLLTRSRNQPAGDA